MRLGCLMPCDNQAAVLREAARLIGSHESDHDSLIPVRFL